MRVPDSKRQGAYLGMKGKMDLVVSLTLAILFIMLSFLSYMFLLPVLPDGIWLSAHVDSILKSSLVALIPSAVLLAILIMVRKSAVCFGLSLILPIIAIMCYAYAFTREGDDYALLIPFLNVFALPSIVIGTIVSLATAMIQRKKEAYSRG